ncbi:hypothetical protein CT0861_05450 [Colletotrichum tofieldiae]|uniref:Uncharacterized protein n=1 Tax=Colletotrichum tofieldiae TaxID=708197 RepID=A0A166TN78_9PEZI|nr:hypothetical protein CT0861_05450 [Colletotrichum tofieldiae]
MAIVVLVKPRRGFPLSIGTEPAWVLVHTINPITPLRLGPRPSQKATDQRDDVHLSSGQHTHRDTRAPKTCEIIFTGDMFRHASRSATWASGVKSGSLFIVGLVSSFSQVQAPSTSRYPPPIPS